MNYAKSGFGNSTYCRAYSLADSGHSAGEYCPIDLLIAVRPVSQWAL